MGSFEFQDEKFGWCPYCQDNTNQTVQGWDNEIGITCDVCEKDLNLQKIKLNDHFIFNNKIYFLDIGNDDELNLMRFEN